MSKIEVYERKCGESRRLTNRDGLLCILQMPSSGVPLRGDVVTLPGRTVGEPESLMAFFRVTARATVWSPHEDAETDLCLSTAWIEVERVPDSEV